MTSEEAILDYAERNHRHVGGPFTPCSAINGDRCDITAALRHAAKIAKEHQDEHNKG